MTSDARILAEAELSLEDYTRAVGALSSVLQVVTGFENVRAQDPVPRLAVDRDGHPTETDLPPGVMRCRCGHAVPTEAEWNTCPKCGSIVTGMNPDDRDPVADAAASDTSKAARRRIARHVGHISRSVRALIEEEVRWTRPTPAKTHELRQAAEGVIRPEDRERYCNLHIELTEGRDHLDIDDRSGSRRLCTDCWNLRETIKAEPAVPIGAVDKALRVLADPRVNQGRAWKIASKNELATAAGIDVAKIANRDVGKHTKVGGRWFSAEDLKLGTRHAS